MDVLSFGKSIHLSVSTYYVCYLVSGLLDSVWYFLVPSICLQILWYHCFPVSIFPWRTSGHFWLLAIINKSSMCPCYMLEHLLGICSVVVWLGLQVELFPVFWGTSILFYKVVLPACNPITSGRVFLFLHILDRICCHLSFFILAILIGVRWNLGVVLIFISLMTKYVEHFFRCFPWIQNYSVENSLFSTVPPFLNRDILFSVV